MANAYRAVYLIHPPFGVTLSATCKQAFIDATPVNLKANITALIDNVNY